MGQRSSSQAPHPKSSEPSQLSVYRRDPSESSTPSSLAPWLPPPKPSSQDPTPQSLLNVMYNGVFMKQIFTSFACKLKGEERKMILLEFPDLNSGGQKTADFKLLSELPDIKDSQLKESVEKLWEKLKPGKEVLVIFHMHPHMTFKVYPLDEL